jgi:hypothetical protein
MNEKGSKSFRLAAGLSAIKWLSLAVTTVAVAGLLAYLETCESSKELGTKAAQTAQGVRESVKELSGIAERFKTGTITTTFRESLPEIASTRGDVLELATAHCTETFSRTDSRTAFWGWFPLGTTVSRIRVPVTFRYHLRLSDGWRLATKGNVCIVLAPTIRPSLPPAIHTDRMETSTAAGWARFNKEQNLAELEKALTPALSARAADPHHRRAVREACRESVRDFVAKWLMREGCWRTDRFTSVVVLFADEVSVRSDEELEAYCAGKTF